MEKNLRKKNREKMYFPAGNSVFGKRISLALNPKAKAYLLFLLHFWNLKF
jgi:hypothetical protein